MSTNKSAWDLIGVTREQLPLVLPVGYKDLSCVVVRGFDNLSWADGREVAIVGVCRRVGWSQGYGARARYVIAVRGDDSTELSISFFGAEPDAESLQDGETILLHGSISTRYGAPILQAPTPYPVALAGRIVPVYPPVRGKITREGVFALISPHLRECLPSALSFIRDRIGAMPLALLRSRIQCRSWTLEQLVTRAHWPQSVRQGNRCIEILDRLAAAIEAYQLQGMVQKAVCRPALNPAPFQFVLDRNAFPLTEEQIRIATQIVDSLRRPEVSKHLLLGDVGFGKSYVIACVVGAVVAGGGRVAVMLPSVILAQQMYSLFCDLMPEHSPRLLGDDSPDTNNTNDRLWIGTTGLTFRTWDSPWDLIVVDEQQRFSVEQRESLAAGQAHILEATATPICRTMALSRYGSDICLHRLTVCPVDRQITSRIVTSDERFALFERVMRIIASGKQVLVVCPKKDETGKKRKKDAEADEIANVAAVASDFRSVFNRYASKLGFNAVVVVATGGQTDEENEAALTAMKTRTANLLVATTVVETGVNIPHLAQVVIYNAERLGAVQLHQLRGRLARAGGTGDFDMYLPQKPSEKTVERMQILVNHTQGYEVAMADMRLRGFGDLAGGKSQSGSGTSILPNRPIDIDALESML